MQLVQVNIKNETQDVAEEQLLTFGGAVDGEVYGAAFGFGSASVVGASHTPTTLAAAISAAINSVAGSIVTATPSTNTVTVVANRAGVPIDMSKFGPSVTLDITVPAAKKAAVVLSTLGFSNVPADGTTTEMVNLENLSKATRASLKSMEAAGLITIKPSLDALVSGVLSGDLALDANESLVLDGIRVSGDVTVSATGTLTATDCFFEGDITVTAGGVCNLSGGRVIGTKTGTVTHDAGDVGL
jgi:hypothetical protein